MANGWTETRRKRQAEAIKRWRPWEHSTGPRTPAGKTRVSRNAYRGGQREKLRGLARQFSALIREQRNVLQDLRDL